MLEEGSPTAHVAIVARAFDIPVVGRVDDATSRIEAGDIVIVDGDHGQVLIRPSEDIQQSVVDAVAERTRRRAYYETLRDHAGGDARRRRDPLLLNAGLLIDLVQLAATGAEGIGLFRTEIPLLTRDAFPDVADQTGFYRRAYEQVGGRPIVFRTLDIGGDKVLPYLSAHGRGQSGDGLAGDPHRARPAGDAAPAAARACCAPPAGRDLCGQVPDDRRGRRARGGARACSTGSWRRAAAEGHEPPRSVKVGVMLEVPSLLWQLPALLERIDFLSIGTNDLAQFLFACDRGNPRLADRYDLLSAPMVALFREVVAQCCAAADVPLSMCGEMAGNPIEAMVLIGLGFRTLSLTATAVGPVKTMIRSLDAGALARYLDEIGERPDHSLRRRLEAYARDHGGRAVNAMPMPARVRHGQCRAGACIGRCSRKRVSRRDASSSGSRRRSPRPGRRAGRGSQPRMRLGRRVAAGAARRSRPRSRRDRRDAAHQAALSRRARAGRAQTICPARPMRSALFAPMPISSGSTPTQVLARFKARGGGGHRAARSGAAGAARRAQPAGRGPAAGRV